MQFSYLFKLLGAQLSCLNGILNHLCICIIIHDNKQKEEMLIDEYMS